MGKKPIVSVTYEHEKISIKNSLPYINCVLHLSCVVHGSHDVKKNSNYKTIDPTEILLSWCIRAAEN